MPDTEVLCFDVYGSTHDQHSIVETLAEVADVSIDVAEEMSELWVEHQIDYSMEVTLMDEYESWWSLTERAFEWVLDYYGLDLSEDERETVMDAYEHLEFYEGIERSSASSTPVTNSTSSRTGTPRCWRRSPRTPASTRSSTGS